MIIEICEKNALEEVKGRELLGYEVKCSSTSVHKNSKLRLTNSYNNINNNISVSRVYFYFSHFTALCWIIILQLNFHTLNAGFLLGTVPTWLLASDRPALSLHHYLPLSCETNHQQQTRTQMPTSTITPTPRETRGPLTNRSPVPTVAVVQSPTRGASCFQVSTVPHIFIISCTVYENTFLNISPLIGLWP